MQGDMRVTLPSADAVRRPGEKHRDKDHTWARKGRGQGDGGRDDSLSEGMRAWAVHNGEAGSPKGEQAKLGGSRDVRLQHVLGAPESWRMFNIRCPLMWLPWSLKTRLGSLDGN